MGQPIDVVFKIVDETTHEPVEQPAWKVLESGVDVGVCRNTILIARDETERPIEQSASLLYDEAGNQNGVVIVFRDITERRNGERTVRDALNYAENIIDTVRDPLVILDTDLRVRTANRSFYQEFGLSREETEGEFIYEVGDGQWEIPGLRKLLEQIIPGNTSFRDFEVKLSLKGIGKRRLLLNARKVFQPGNHSELILLSMEDVTPTWRAGVDFEDNRERYRVIVEGATGFAIFTFDINGVISSWNPGAETMLGYTESEILGQNFRIIFTPEDLKERMADQEMTTAASEGRALDERWHIKKNGDLFWAQGLVMPLKDDTDTIRGFVKIIRDMTTERRLEEALKKRTAELEEADLHKNEWLITDSGVVVSCHSNSD